MKQAFRGTNFVSNCILSRTRLQCSRSAQLATPRVHFRIAPRLNLFSTPSVAVRMKVNAEFSEKVTLHADEMDWIPSPMPGVERKCDLGGPRCAPIDPAGCPGFC